MDYYWERLSEGGDENAQQCGWLKDKYGVSWQAASGILSMLINAHDYEKSQRVMEAMLQMKKIDIDALKRAYGPDNWHQHRLVKPGEARCCCARRSKSS